jgi:trans-2,3-dihydro-3-hydroxyanthranilate isomerase
MRYRYLHLDVFTPARFAGNQLAVLPDARGLIPPIMQQIALEMAFSETTFILPRESEETDVRMRIFTPGAELPMAGHPTVGSTFALAHEGVIAPGRQRFVFGLGIGPTPVEIEWADGRARFVWMTQPLPRFGSTLDDIAGVASALGLRERDIGATGLPVQEVSCGVPFLFVPLVSRAAVDAVDPTRSALLHICRAVSADIDGVFLFSPESGPDGATVYSRMFAPGTGIHEDPATGGASGPLGAYLVRHGVVPAGRADRMLSLQGVKMRRPSHVYIDIGVEDGAIARVRVGGESVLVAEGELAI